MNYRHSLWMDYASRAAQESYCQRRKVGAVIVKNGTPIAVGWNGTPSGESNQCEASDGTTLPHVVHAEDNALRKLTRGAESGQCATLYVTTAPCANCASRIADAGIMAVYYKEAYSSCDGIEYLQRHGVKVEQYGSENE